jgi:protein O-mannosyl-transferase
MTPKAKAYGQDILLFSIAFVIFGSSLRNGFVGSDLIYYIGNEIIKSFDIGVMLRSGALEVDYCPLRDISLALDYLVWGENPFGFHLTNLVLYGFSVVAVKHLFSGLQSIAVGEVEPDKGLQGQLAPFLAALLFAALPAHGEVVYAVSNRGVILSGLFFSLSCILFLRYMRHESRKRWYYSGSLFFFAASVLSKEYSIILPLALVLFAAYGDCSKRVRHLVYTMPFFLISGLLYFVFRTIAVSARFIPQSSESLLAEITSRTGIAIQIAAYYLFRMLNAEKAGIFIGNSFPDAPQALLLFSLAVLAAVLLAALVLRKRFPQLLFGLTLYLICLIPVLNFFKTYPVTADRFAYLPSLGLFFAITAASQMQRIRLFAALASILAVFWAAMSMQQTVYWKDNITYWEHITGIEPTPEAYSNLGSAYLKNNDRLKAREAFLNALQHLPANAGSRTLGDILFMLGDNQGAIQAFESVLEQNRISSDRTKKLDWQFYNNLATAYKNVGNMSAALRNLEASISLKPGSAGLYNSLGALHGEMKQYDRAVLAFEKSMSLDPAYGFAPLNLAKTYLDMGDSANAARYMALVRERFPQLRADVDMLEKR